MLKKKEEILLLQQPSFGMKIQYISKMKLRPHKFDRVKDALVKSQNQKRSLFNWKN